MEARRTIAQYAITLAFADEGDDEQPLVGRTARALRDDLTSNLRSSVRIDEQLKGDARLSVCTLYSRCIYRLLLEGIEGAAHLRGSR